MPDIRRRLGQRRQHTGQLPVQDIGAHQRSRQAAGHPEARQHSQQPAEGERHHRQNLSGQQGHGLYADQQQLHQPGVLFLHHGPDHIGRTHQAHHHSQDGIPILDPKAAAVKIFLRQGGAFQLSQLLRRQPRRTDAGIPDRRLHGVCQQPQLALVHVVRTAYRHLIAGDVTADGDHGVGVLCAGGKDRIRPVGISGKIQIQSGAVFQPHRRQAAGIRYLRRLAAHQRRQRHAHRRQQHHEKQRYPVCIAFQQLRQGEAVYLAGSGQVTHQTHPLRFPRRSRAATAHAG